MQDENCQLENLVGLTFRETSCHVLEEIMTRHKLMDHLRALRRYLLLGQGDFIHYLMELLKYSSIGMHLWHLWKYSEFQS